MSSPASRTLGVGRRFMLLGFGETIARLVAFGASLYMARVLGASTYGVVSFATAIILYLSRVVDGGIEFAGLGISAIAREPRKLAALVPGVILLRVGTAVIIAAILGALWLIIPGPETSVLALYGLTLLALGMSARWVLLGLEQSKAVAFSRIFGETLFAAAVVLTVHSSTDVFRVPLAQLLGDAFAAMLLLAVVRGTAGPLRPRFDWTVVRPLVLRSWRVVLATLLGLLVYNSDLILLRFLRDSGSVGLYAAAYALISFLLNLGAVYYQSLMPALAREAMPAGAEGGTYQRALTHVFAATLPVAVGGLLVANELITFLYGPDYGGAGLALQILVWSLPFALMRDVATAGLIVRHSEASVLRLTAWSAAASVALSLILIPPYGVVGAAVATLLTDIGRSAAALVAAHHRGFVLPSPVRLAKPLISATLMFGVMRVVAEWGLPAMLVGAFVAYFGTLMVLGAVKVRRDSLPELDL